MNERTVMADEITPLPWRAEQRSSGYPDYEGGPEVRLWDTTAANGAKVAMGTIYGDSEKRAKLFAAAPDLLAACQAQHEALDRLFARLIVLTREHTPDDVFFPTKSGQPWEACQLGVAAIDKAGGKRR